MRTDNIQNKTLIMATECRRYNSIIHNTGVHYSGILGLQLLQTNLFPPAIKI